MAEIIVLGYPGGLPGESRGSVWISSPRRGQIVHQSVPLRLEAHHVHPASVLVHLDGEEIYRGASLPEDLTLNASGLAPGRRRLTATILDGDGREYRYTTEFVVEHARIAEPEAGARLRGEVILRVEVLIPEDEITEARVDWVPIGETEKVVQITTVYHGSEAPVELALDTLAIPDGA